MSSNRRGPALLFETDCSCFSIRSCRFRDVRCVIVTPVHKNLANRCLTAAMVDARLGQHFLVALQPSPTYYVLRQACVRPHAHAHAHAWKRMHDECWPSMIICARVSRTLLCALISALQADFWSPSRPDLLAHGPLRGVGYWSLIASAES